MPSEALLCFTRMGVLCCMVTLRSPPPPPPRIGVYIGYFSRWHKIICSLWNAHTRAHKVQPNFSHYKTHIKSLSIFLLLLFLSNYCFIQIFSLLEISVHNIQCKSITLLTGVTTAWFAFLLSQARTHAPKPKWITPASLATYHTHTQW